MGIEQLKMSEAERNRRTLVAIHDANARGRVRRWPAWTRRSYWTLLLQKARALSHHDVDKFEYDRQFGDL